MFWKPKPTDEAKSERAWGWCPSDLRALFERLSNKREPVLRFTIIGFESILTLDARPCLAEQRRVERTNEITGYLGHPMASFSASLGASESKSEHEDSGAASLGSMTISSMALNGETRRPAIVAHLLTYAEPEAEAMKADLLSVLGRGGRAHVNLGVDRLDAPEEALAYFMEHGHSRPLTVRTIYLGTAVGNVRFRETSKLDRTARTGRMLRDVRRHS